MAISLHPQVKSGANWASYATLGLTLLNSITPEALSSLGKWEPLVTGAVVIASYVLGSIAKGAPVSLPSVAEAAVSALAPVVDKGPVPIIVKPVNPLPVKADPAPAEAAAPVAPVEVPVEAPNAAAAASTGESPAAA